MAKAPSRAQRWATACAAASAALEELVDLQSEYEAWKDGVPDNMQSGAMYEKLEAVCDLDLSGAQDTINEAEGVELPLGFGRD